MSADRSVPPTTRRREVGQTRRRPAQPHAGRPRSTRAGVAAPQALPLRPDPFERRPSDRPRSRPHPRTQTRRGPANRSPRSGAASKEGLGRRIRFIRIVLVLVFLLIVYRLVDVQVFESSRYGASASEELTQQVPIPALRGTIYDRQGSVLALSVATETVLADDFQVQHPQSEARRLAPLLGLSTARLAALLHQDSGYVPLAENVPQARAAQVSAGAFAGITMVASSQRVTPNGSLAAPVLGTVHQSGTGAAGLEYQYNTTLAGKAGSETLLESPSGVVLPGTPVAEHEAARRGTGLELTLDEPLQYTTEQDLAAQIVATHALSGVAEVMDVRTGDILSMASLVNNTPKAGTAATPPTTGTVAKKTAGTISIGPKGPVSEASSDLALTQLYEPGSVFKLVTFSAALQDGLISPSTTFTVPDQIQFDGSTFHDAEVHPTEQLTATQILAQSSNIGTSEIARDLGESRLLAQVGQLGFGTRTGLGYPGEESGHHRRGGPVGADRLRLAAHRPGRRGHRPAGP